MVISRPLVISVLALPDKRLKSVRLMTLDREYITHIDLREIMSINYVTSVLFTHE